ncbi:MAG TPA: hypothetical protein VJ784_11420 [Pyrinomonadaceae bacterium]|nr:hypothetical protein [Pyrinomonadaceae bacterium]
MRIRNNDPLDLEGIDGEQITVGVSATGTKRLVSFTLNGQTSSLPTTGPAQIRFVLRKVNSPVILSMLFTFSESEGGNYDLTASGSPGGQIARHSVTQFSGIPGDSIFFTIHVI